MKTATDVQHHALKHMYKNISEGINKRLDLTEQQKHDLIKLVFDAAKAAGLVPDISRLTVPNR